MVSDVKCENGKEKSLGMSRMSRYPRTWPSLVTTNAVSPDPGFEDQFRFDPRDEGACLFTGTYFEVNFGRTVNVYAVVIQGMYVLITKSYGYFTN